MSLAEPRSPQDVSSKKTSADDLVAYAITTEWGSLALVGSGDLCEAVFLPEDSRSLKRRVWARYPEARWQKSPPPFARTLEKSLAAYFQGEKKSLPLPPKDWLLSRTAFERSVYQTLCQTSAGQALTYGELAAKAGYPGAARAVGSAMARNPWPLLVPCHRVIPAGGKKLGNYSGAGGTRTKARLLAWEGHGNRFANH